MQNKKPLYFAFLLGAFVLLAFGGRYFFTDNPAKSVQDGNSKNVAEVQSQKNENATTAPAVASPKTTTAPKDDTSSACVDQLATQVAREKTEFEKGSILVGFNANVSYADAVKVLAMYGVSVLASADAESRYAPTRTLVGFVTDGTEIVKVCATKRDASVRYSGLNELFSLHD